MLWPSQYSDLKGAAGGCGGRRPLRKFNIVGKWGVEVRRSCAAKRRGGSAWGDWRAPAWQLDRGLIGSDERGVFSVQSARPCS
jgi:hypothetical protein